MGMLTLLIFNLNIHYITANTSFDAYIEVNTPSSTPSGVDANPPVLVCNLLIKDTTEILCHVMSVSPILTQIGNWKKSWKHVDLNI